MRDIEQIKKLTVLRKLININKIRNLKNVPKLEGDAGTFYFELY